MIVAECGAIRSARPPVATIGAFGAQLCADAVDDRVDLAREAVDEPRLQRRSGRLADHPLRRLERNLGQPRGTREERIHRDLDAWRQHAACELAGCVDDVEVRRGAEVDDHRGCAVALARRDRIRDPVRPDLARVVVADHEPGRDAGADHEQVGARPALRERLVLAHERRDRRAEHDPGERVELHERAQHHRELVPGVRAVRADAELLGERRALEQAEDRLRVADVDRQEHGASLNARTWFATTRLRYRSSISLPALADALGERLAVSTGSSPSPRSSSIVTSLEV